MYILFFSSNCCTFLYKPKYLPSHLYSCKILFLRLKKNKKDLLDFFKYSYILHSGIRSINNVNLANQIGALCANTQEK